MFNFYIKKNFCDGWDNFFFILLSNVIPLAIGCAGYIVFTGSSQINGFIPNAVFVLFCALFMTFVFPWGINARKLSDFAVAGFKLYFKSLKSSFLPAFILGFLIGLFLVVVRIAVVYYLILYFKQGSYVGLFFAALLIWFTVVCLIALQWFIPLYYLQEENTFIKCLKKSFIIFFDNAMFSTGVFFYNIVLLAVSCFTFFLVPGVCGIVLSCTNALRLRLYKYDWLEEHPDYIDDKDKRSDVPWDELIAEDVEALGPRKLSSFLFPWK